MSNMTEVNEGFIQYPVPGIDNDSQGFRDRFAIVRNNLNTAREELIELQQLTPKVNQNNNFNGQKIIDANLSATTLEANSGLDGDPITDETLSISWLSGAVQVLRVGEGADDGQGGQLPLTLDFTNFPEDDDRFAKITLIVNSDTSSPVNRDLVWPEDTKINFDIADSNVSATGTKIFEVFTYDSGDNLFVTYIGLFE